MPGAYDGTLTVIQPLIAPLYGGKSEIDFLALLTGQAGKPSTISVREFWQAQLTGVQHFDAFWEKNAARWSDGRHRISSQASFIESGIGAQFSADPQQGLEIIFRPDPASGTAGLRITAGCRNCRSRSQNSLGTACLAEPENGPAPGTEK